MPLKVSISLNYPGTFKSLLRITFGHIRSIHFRSWLAFTCFACFHIQDCFSVLTRMSVGYLSTMVLYLILHACSCFLLLDFSFWGNPYPKYGGGSSILPGKRVSYCSIINVLQTVVQQVEQVFSALCFTELHLCNRDSHICCILRMSSYQHPHHEHTLHDGIASCPRPHIQHVQLVSSCSLLNCPCLHLRLKWPPLVTLFYCRAKWHYLWHWTRLTHTLASFKLYCLQL